MSFPVSAKVALVASLCLVLTLVEVASLTKTIFGDPELNLEEQGTLNITWTSPGHQDDGTNTLLLGLTTKLLLLGVGLSSNLLLLLGLKLDKPGLLLPWLAVYGVGQHTAHC